jgi:hypothetical protein
MDPADGALLIVAVLGFGAFMVGLYFARKESRERHAGRPVDHPRAD